MKKLIIGTALLLSAFNLFAEEINCESIEKLARSVMEARQSGVSLKEIIKAADGLEVGEIIAKSAFGVSKYETSRYREDAVEEFANKYYLACLNYNNENK